LIEETLQGTAERPLEVWKHMLQPEGNPTFVHENNGCISALIGGMPPDERSVAETEMSTRSVCTRDTVSPERVRRKLENETTQ